MTDISTKTLGFLIDELITAEMKVAHEIPEALERRDELLNYIANNYDFGVIWRTMRVVGQLWDASEQCFEAQDVVMNSDSINEVAAAAKNAQIMNAMRNQCVRKIDEIAGQSTVSQLGKTYG